MSMTFFCIPVFSPEAQTRALNEFLRKHPQARVDRQLIVDGQNSAWAVCCTVPDEGMSSESVPFSQAGDGVQRKRIDYREILVPEHFARYAVLRELRNRLAKEESIPPYSIFTNAQLAEMVQFDPLDRQSLASIDGVGEKRVARYADLFISELEAR